MPKRPEKNVSESVKPMLLTVRQVAEALAFSERHIHNLTASGVLRAVRIGSKSVRYRPADVEALVEKYLEQAPSEG